MDHRRITVVLAVVVVALAALTGYETERLHTTSENVATLKAALTGQEAEQASLAKIDCGKRAADLFRRMGYSETGATDSKHLSDYTDHFNTALRRCLIAMESTSFQDGRTFINKYVLDVDEKKSIAEYTWMSGDGKAIGDKVLSCQRDEPDKPPSPCNSAFEYDDFVAKLMQ